MAAIRIKVKDLKKTIKEVSKTLKERDDTSVQQVSPPATEKPQQPALNERAFEQVQARASHLRGLTNALEKAAQEKDQKNIIDLLSQALFDCAMVSRFIISDIGVANEIRGIANKIR